jgi:DNA mismatch repair protein MSH6
MACRVETPSEAGVETFGRETVTFLYTLASGNCPRSYGVNVARLAGLPETVCLAAARRAAHLEAGQLETLVGDARSRERILRACRDVLRDVSASDVTESNVRRAQDKARAVL